MVAPMRLYSAIPVRYAYSAAGSSWEESSVAMWLRSALLEADFAVDIASMLLRTEQEWPTSQIFELGA